MHFAKRLLTLPPLLLVISFIAFLLVHAAPGGPFDRQRKPASPEVERAIKAKYHLDEPLLKQYLRYLGLIWEKDSQDHWHHAPPGFDVSLQYRNHSLIDIVCQALPVSLALGMLAFCFALGTGLPMGFIMAARRGRWQQHATALIALLSICVPGLIIAPFLIMFFAIKWRLLPVGLWVSPWHAVLPVVALGFYFSGRVGRLLEQGMLATMSAPFVLAARAKGLTENALLLKHVFRLAVLPVVSWSGPMLADLLTGSFVIESIFQIPGLGLHMVNSSLNADYTLTVGLAVLYAAILVILNLVVDFSYTLLDPRVRYE